MKKLIVFLLLLCNTMNAQFFTNTNHELCYKLYQTGGVFYDNAVYLVFEEKITSSESIEFEKRIKKLSKKQLYEFTQQLSLEGFRIETDSLEFFTMYDPVFEDKKQSWDGKLKRTQYQISIVPPSPID